MLWQTAVPIVLGLALRRRPGWASVSVLLRMVEHAGRGLAGRSCRSTGVGAASIVLVTLLSLPPLWRLMRPDGLRTE